MKKYILINLLLLICLINQLHGQGALKFKHQDTISSQKDTVTLFAPGNIPTSALINAAPAFTADGNSVYLGQASSVENISIMVSHLSGDHWSVPKTAPFSGKYRDLEPTFAPNGKYMIFASSRPTATNGTELDGYYNEQVFPGNGGNLWKVTLTKKGWGKPEVLPEIINSNSSVFTPSIATDGSLYFMRADSGHGFHIYRAQMRNGQFEKPIRVSFSDNKNSDYDPAVAPDESFIIFSSGRPPASHTSDLFIVFRIGKDWGEPIDLRSVLSDKVYGIEARFSLDYKTLYFTNSRSPSGAIIKDGRYIWKVDITALLKDHGINEIPIK